MNLISDTVDDVATASNFHDIKVFNYHLDLDVSFEKQELTGTAVLDFKACNSTSVVNLDVHETLQVHKVCSGGLVLKYETSPFTGYGSLLKIQLTESVAKDKTITLHIDYTSTRGPGVCWLDPAQTAGKEKPYLYTQGQAVMNRSFFPCQDTPAVKSTYSANIKVPSGFTAVMSANESSYGQVANMKGDKDCHYFKLTIPIASYLIALAVGDICSAEIGPRSRVWTEPCLLNKAKAEFDGVVENFISTGEKLFGPYVWGHYDILVMPPSFPFGGMENPCLTFVTPCLLVGDKSLTDVVIHEVSHSWFGNLVTNANWGEFWLNEGFTMYAQRCITEELFGTAYACLEAATGQALLRQHIQNTGEEHPLNKLRVVIKPGVDPDDTYNETPYEKGFAFVSYLQSLSGDKKVFIDFLKSYVAKYKYKSLVAEDMLQYYLECFPEVRKQKLEGGEIVDREKNDFNDWLHKSGWPSYTPDLSAGQELTGPAEALAHHWIANGNDQIPEIDISSWKTYQVLHFLDTLLEKDLTSAVLQKMAQTYSSISRTDNSEIRLRWSLLTIKNDYQDDFSNIQKFLECQGKQKYTLPIYRALVKGSDAAKGLAGTVFKETKDRLHVTVQGYVQTILDSS